MIDRQDTNFDLIVRSGIEMSLIEGNLSALKMMEKAGLPCTIIHRVLFEQHKLRSTDQYLLNRLHLA